MKKYIFTGAFIGLIVPLIFMLVDVFVPTIVHKFGGNDLDALNAMAYFVMVQFTLWPSSFILMALQDNGDPGDDHLRAVAIILNMLLYAVLGLVIRPVVIWFKRRGVSLRAGD